jgi:hypothetical protein
MTRVNVTRGEKLKTGDTEPDLTVQLIKDNDNPKDLSTGSPEVTFLLGQEAETELLVDDNTTGNVSITDAANGEVSYSWQSGDTDTSGTYIGEVRVSDGSGESTYPNNGTFNIYIEEGLN